MRFPCPLVHVDSKHYFQYVEDCIPVNRAVIQLMDENKTPTGVVFVYRLLTEDEDSTGLQAKISDSIGPAHQAATQLVKHAQMCLLPHLDNPGAWMAVSFIGKAFNSVERRWMSSGNFRIVQKEQ